MEHNLPAGRFVIRAGFSDGTEDSFIVDESAGDRCTVATDEDVVIAFAAKPTKTILAKSPTGVERPFTVAAQPARTIVWRAAHIKSLEWAEVPATETPAYQPKTT